MPLSQTGPNTYVLSVGSDDDTDGISIVVAGEDFPRVQLTSAGVLSGDGSVAPVAPQGAVDPAEETDGTYLLLATVTDGVAVYTLVDSTDYENA
jgi:hypothetical protein